MDLREHFIKTLRIMAARDPYFKIETDEIINLDGQEVEIDVIVGSKKCSKIYFVFRNMDVKEIYSITSKDQLYKALAYVSENHINQLERTDLALYRKMDDLKDYALVFFEEICRVAFTNINPKILPICFYPFDIEPRNYEGKRMLGGFIIHGKQIVMNIENCGLIDTDTIKRTIRHEIIHYCLCMCDQNFEEGSGLFWALAEFYDAGPHVEMSPKEKVIYEKFNQIVYDS